MLRKRGTKRRKSRLRKKELNDCGIQILMEWIVAYLDISMSQQKGVNHPQTSGKIERFYGTLEAVRWREIILGNYRFDGTHKI